MPQVCKYLFGMHDHSDDWVRIVRESGKQAWCVHTTAIGCDPNDRNGGSFAHDNTTAIVRLNNGYGTTGTIPLPERYDDFSKRCANFVAASQGIEWVVIGNEIALKWEWADGVPLTLDNYVKCYVKCYDAIKAVRPDVMVAPQAPAPWNASVPDCPDWIDQLKRQLEMVGGKADWICLHAYTRGYENHTFHTGNKMDPPWGNYHSGWEALWDYMRVIPESHRHLPCIITEANGDHSWPDRDTGWIEHMYGVIGAWNDNPANQKIIGACLFRWAPHDEKWDISRHGASVEMWRNALRHEQTHKWAPVDMTGKLRVSADGGLNLRSAPNTSAEVVMILRNGAILDKLSDSGDWVEVEIAGQSGYVHRDYVA